jgi:hypothetical protein
MFENASYEQDYFKAIHHTEDRLHPVWAFCLMFTLHIVILVTVVSNFGALVWLKLLIIPALMVGFIRIYRMT